MGYWAKIISGTALLASFSFAQTYDLPIIFVDTKQKCLDKNVTEKIPATMRVLDGKTNNVADSAKGTLYDIGIKVRGQSSAMFPKPGYSVEVRDDKGEGMDVSMFGLPPADDWVLHGPYVDKSMLRNALAYWLFRQAGRYAPRTKHFDLYINGVYRGVYVMVEKIKRGKYRVNVSKLKETDIAGDSLTGGYIWAFDKVGTNTGGGGSNNQGGIQAEGFNTSDGLNVILHYPKKANIQKEQEEYLKKYLNDLEALFKNGKNGDGFDKYVDLGSAVDYVLHQEITNNGDSYWCSFFLHKPKDKTKNGVFTEGKVTLGPPWDFNLAMSNGGMMGFGGSGNSWQIESSSKSGNGGMWGMGGGSLIAPKWLTGMWKRSDYQSELKKRWAELRSGVWHTKVMDAYLDSMKTYLTKAAERNFKRWPNLGKNSGQNDPDPEPMKYCNSSSGGMGMGMGGNNADTWEGEVEHLRKKMKERMQWMDQQLGFTEPSSPIVTQPVDPSIHEPDWENDKKKDSIPDNNPPQDIADNFSRLSPTNYFDVNGDMLEIQTSLGGTFALIDLNGTVLYKTRIKKGLTTMKIPGKAKNTHWIATLNGKMLGR
ncbi:MAG: CotH kinase family protein [Fibrobacter sp.]|uniref:CotH kinase family protein n=1 Tax=Fibrobacter sp. UWB5 TaxID=1964360 RepID=UPI000B521ED7|nr:CotH kinase family protein [Fibrobacter sp. UWB5]MBR4680450.1 CotH kinase family protein [Fibrobacter sp.]OWV13389.1 spore coat protein CotH [Fibrobacter sp. UWB5]